MTQTRAELYTRVCSKIKPVANDLTTREAEEIIEHVTGITRLELHIHPRISVPPHCIAAIEEIVEKRLLGIPLPYILGYAYFFGYKFIIDTNVLIPRMDTETLVAAVLASQPSSYRSFIDLCTGSGIIAAVLSKERPAWYGIATDISEKAARVARKNCTQYVHVLCGDVLTHISPGYCVDFIVSNPPYIAADEMAHLEESVKDYEPYQALFGGKDGCNFYRYLAKNAAMYLKDNGKLYCEISSVCSERIEDIFRQNRWTNIKIHSDLAQRPRVLYAEKKQKS